jgi:hypothetical protein
MAHRLAPGAEIELDDIWFWTAKESGSIDIADRLVDSITERFFLPPPRRRPASRSAKLFRRPLHHHLPRGGRRRSDPARHRRDRDIEPLL